MRKILSIILISLLIILNTLPPINSFAEENEPAQSSGDGYVHQTGPEVERESIPDYDEILNEGKATHERKNRTY